MKDIQIYIKPFYYLTEKIFDGGFLDIPEGTNIPLVFQNIDSNDISKQNCSFSKTIILEGTKNNNKIFELINKIEKLYNAENDVDIKNIYPNRKLNCTLLVNKNIIMEGVFYIKNIKKTYDGNNYKTIYECNIFENKKNVFSQLKEKTLNELDFSSGFIYRDETYTIGDHISNDDNIVDAILNNDYLNIYNYPIINYGYNQNELNIQEQNTNFPYQSISSGVVYPSVYIKPILIRIFKDFDIFYESDFFDGTTYNGLFNTLISFYNKNKELNNLKVFGYPSNGFSFINLIDNNIPLGKNNTILSGKTYRFFNVCDFLDSEVNLNGTTIRVGGNPRKNGKYKYTLLIDVSNDESFYYYDPITGELDASSSFTLKKKFGYPSYGTFKKEISPGVYIEDEYLISENIFGIRKTDIVSNPQSVNNYTYIHTGITELSDNEMLYVDCNCGYEIRYDQSGTEIINPVALEGNGIYLELEKIRELSENDNNVKINEILPNMTCYDFVMNIIKMFNLKLQNFKNILSSTSGKFYIEPYNDFFKKGKTLDWSDKIDYSKKYSFGFLNNFYYFNLKENENYFSNLYNDVNGKIFGCYKLEKDDSIINPGKYNIDLLNQSYINKNELGDTYNISIPYLYENINDTIYDNRLDIDFMVGILNKKSIPTYGGVYSLNFGGYEDGNIINQYVNYITWVNSFNTLGGDTYSINFYDENNIGYGLYDIFYKNNVYDCSYITNNSREVIYYIDLNLNDIINFNFWDTILINGQYFYVKKIEYDPSTNNSSKVTLIKKVGDFVSTLPSDSYILKNDSGEYITTPGKIII